MIAATWFNSPERITALQLESLSWLGTPFFANGSEKGKGVSCHKLVSAIYRAIGCCDIRVPDVAMLNTSARVSLVENFISTVNSFARVEKSSPLLPGDLLGFRLGRVVHHLGIYQGMDKVIHAMQGTGVALASMKDPACFTKLGAVWRRTP